MVSDSVGKTSSRTDRTPSTSSTTSFSYAGDGENSVLPHFITGASTIGHSPGSGSYTADAAGNTLTRPAPGGWDADFGVG